MKIERILLCWMAVVFAGCSGCRQRSLHDADCGAVTDSIRLQYAPDRRDDVFAVNIVRRNGRVILEGFTSVEAAKTALRTRIQAVCPEAIDSVALLPDHTVGDQPYGVVNISVADSRQEANHAAEMGTQLLLGMPLQVLQRDGWWRIKSPEGYLGWMEGNAFVRMDRDRFNQWTAARKIIFTDIYGFAYESPDATRHVSDLVFGNLLKWEGDSGEFFKVSYPDGRMAYIPKHQGRRYEDWLSSVRLTEESIVQKALMLKGIPYTWGGTSVKSMDCSGFVKTVMLMHGVILRRDASQQAKTGIPVDVTDGYDLLRPGDLLFFGRKAQNGKRERVRHVALYIGNKEFIHANGYVRINSLDSTQAHYDRYNTRELIRAARIIGATGTDGIRNMDNHPLYQEQK